MTRKFHTANSYARAENWLQDVEAYTFRTRVLPLTRAQGKAITRYREEVKLRAAVRDQERLADGEDTGPHMAGGEWAGASNATLHSPEFLDEMYAFIMQDWQQDPETLDWHKALMEIQEQLDEAIAHFDSGAFVKLSIRSPKDATLNLTRTRVAIRAALEKSTLEPGTPAAASEEVTILNQVCADMLRCVNGEQALRLLIESDRAHTDLQCHELFLESGEEFNLKLIVREWCDKVDADWEFRGFVVNGVLTSVTQYNDFVFDPRMAEGKDTIRALITECWDAVKESIYQHSENYSIDFAVTPDLSSVLIVEVNDFLPPLAGSGLFDWHNEEDRKIVEGDTHKEGDVFEFRVREGHLGGLEQAIKGQELETVRTIHPPLREFMRQVREENAPGGSTCVVC